MILIIWGNIIAEFDSKDFGKRLKNYRIQKGLSQENMAKILNKNRSTIVRYEKGEILPDVRDISIICQELGIYEADLYGNDANITTQSNKSKKLLIQINYIQYMCLLNIRQ